MFFTTIHGDGLKKTQGGLAATGSATGNDVAVFIKFIVAAVEDGLAQHFFGPLYPGLGAGTGDAEFGGELLLRDAFEFCLYKRLPMMVLLVSLTI